MAYTTTRSYSGGSSSNPNDFLNQLGYGNLISSAQKNTDQLLNGLPSVDAARTANAYFGVNSGMPGSDFVRNRGYDLYNQKAQENNQTGLQNLLSLISGTSGPALTNQGQQMQNTQFNQAQGQNQSQFNRNMQLQDFLAQLQAVGLGQNIVNSGKTPLSNFNF